MAVNILFRNNPLGQDQSKNCGRVHVKQPDSLARRYNFWHLSSRMLLVCTQLDICPPMGRFERNEGAKLFNYRGLLPDNLRFLVILLGGWRD